MNDDYASKADVEDLRARMDAVAAVPGAQSGYALASVSKTMV